MGGRRQREREREREGARGKKKRWRGACVTAHPVVEAVLRQAHKHGLFFNLIHRRGVCVGGDERINSTLQRRLWPPMPPRWRPTTHEQNKFGRALNVCDLVDKSRDALAAKTHLAAVNVVAVLAKGNAPNHEALWAEHGGRGSVNLAEVGMWSSCRAARRVGLRAPARAPCLCPRTSSPCPRRRH